VFEQFLTRLTNDAEGPQLDNRGTARPARRWNNWDSNRGSLNKRGPFPPILAFNIALSKSVDALRGYPGCLYRNKHTIYERYKFYTESEARRCDDGSGRAGAGQSKETRV